MGYSERRTTREVSDTHRVPRPKVTPMRTVAVQSATPKLAPLIVETTVCATPPLSTAVTTGASYAKAIALVCARIAAPALSDDRPAVMTARDEDAARWASITNDVPEIQAVMVAAGASPIATAKSMIARLPKLMPLSVREAAAVGAALLGTMLVRTGASIVKLHLTCVAMPSRLTVSSAVSDVATAPLICLVMHNSAVCEIHCDEAQLNLATSTSARPVSLPKRLPLIRSGIGVSEIGAFTGVRAEIKGGPRGESNVMNTLCADSEFPTEAATGTLALADGVVGATAHCSAVAETHCTARHAVGPMLALSTFVAYAPKLRPRRSTCALTAAVLHGDTCVKSGASKVKRAAGVAAEQDEATTIDLVPDERNSFDCMRHMMEESLNQRKSSQPAVPNVAFCRLSCMPKLMPPKFIVTSCAVLGALMTVDEVTTGGS